MARTFQPTIGDTPQAVERSRQLAQVLAQGAITQPQQQVVSGVAVPYSPIQGLTQLAQALLARNLAEKADEKEQQMQSRQQAQVMGWLEGMPQARPEMETEGPPVPGETMATTAATAPSRNEMMAWALRGAAMPGAGQIAGPFLAQAMKQPEGFTLKPGEVRFEGGSRVAELPGKPEEVKAPTSRQVPIGDEVVTQEFDPKSRSWVEVGRGKKAPIASVEVKNINEGEKEQFKALQKEMGEYRVQVQKAGVEAPRQLARLDRMERLLEGVEGGKYSDNMAQVASMANSLGIKIDPRLGDKEAAQSLAIEMASNFRQPGTGPMTDKDFENFMKRVPDLSKTSAGRKEITRTMREFLKDDIENAKLAREYAKKNRGLLDEGFFEQVGQNRANRGFGSFDNDIRSQADAIIGR